MTRVIEPFPKHVKIKFLNLTNKTHIFQLGTRENNLISSGTEYWGFAAQTEEDILYLLTDLLTESVSVTTDLTDVTLVSDDTCWRLD